MSATVTEKTKSGLIQFQKFQRFLRGQWSLRFAVTSGTRDQPIALGLRKPLSSQSMTGEVSSGSI